MNNQHEGFDWHKEGVFVALDPQGLVLWGTFASTGYSARSELVRQLNRRWSVMNEEGFVIVELIQRCPRQLEMFS